MWVLPHTALSSGTKIEKHTILIEIMLIEELSGNLSQRSWGLVHSLGSSRIDRLSSNGIRISLSLSLICAAHTHARKLTVNLISC